MINKIGQIFEGFKNLVLNEGDKELITFRAPICASCEVFENNICKKNRGGCGCYIPAKIRSKDSSCPIGKW